VESGDSGNQNKGEQNKGKGIKKYRSPAQSIGKLGCQDSAKDDGNGFNEK